MLTWLVIGASRGIGLEFVRQLIANQQRVIATVRDMGKGADLWQIAGSAALGQCTLLLCDVSDDAKIDTFVSEVKRLSGPVMIDHVIMNVGMLQYPNRITEVHYSVFEDHFRINCVGPIITIQKLIAADVQLGCVAFMSSDSGSATNFLQNEDGFGAFSASKAALNQSIRHMAAELGRSALPTTLLAVHPGDVASERSDLENDPGPDGIISHQDSVAGMIELVTSKKQADSGTFWAWNGKPQPW